MAVAGAVPQMEAAFLELMGLRVQLLYIIKKAAKGIFYWMNLNWQIPTNMSFRIFSYAKTQDILFFYLY